MKYSFTINICFIFFFCKMTFKLYAMYQSALSHSAIFPGALVSHFNKISAHKGLKTGFTCSTDNSQPTNL